MILLTADLVIRLRMIWSGKMFGDFSFTEKCISYQIVELLPIICYYTLR